MLELKSGIQLEKKVPSIKRRLFFTLSLMGVQKVSIFTFIPYPEDKFVKKTRYTRLQAIGIKTLLHYDFLVILPSG